MLRRTLLVLPLATLLVEAAHAATPGLDPVTIIKTLYAGYQAPPTEAPESPTEGQKTFFTDALETLYVAATNAPDDDLPLIDWDVFANGQDFQISDVTVTATPVSGNSAMVTASFKNFDEPTTVIYAFVTTPQGWRVADLSYPPSVNFPEGFSLKAYIAAGNSNETPAPTMP